MTLYLTADQITDMQGDLDIDSSESVFTDVELNRLYNRANGDYKLAVILAFEQLLAGSSKWVSYTEGQTQEDRSDRFKQVMQLVEYKRAQWIGSDQARMVHIRSVPTPRRDVPYERRGYGDSNGGWGRRGGGGGWG